MTPNQIITVCLRLVALIWLLYVVSHSYGLFAYLKRDADVTLSTPVVWLFAALQVATCAVLWFFPASIAAKLLPPSRTSPEATPATALQWQTLGAVCIGLWGLSRSIPDAVYWLTFLNMAASKDVPFSYLDAEQQAGAISTVVELVLGFWLVFGAKGIAAFLLKARTAGVTR